MRPAARRSRYAWWVKRRPFCAGSATGLEGMPIHRKGSRTTSLLRGKDAVHKPASQERPVEPTWPAALLDHVSHSKGEAEKRMLQVFGSESCAAHTHFVTPQSGDTRLLAYGGKNLCQSTWELP